jgi:zinc transport system substrate-binding protein
VVVALSSIIFLLKNFRQENKFANDSRISVATTLVPFADIIKNITGEKVIVETLVKPGQNPHSFEPLPEQIKRVSQAQIYFRISSVFPIENALIPKIHEFNHAVKIINLSENVEIKNNDPHIWLSPKRMQLICQKILDELILVDEKNKEFYIKNYNESVKKLKQEDSLLTELLTAKKQKYLVVYHSAWQYFCDDYGLQEIAIEEEGKSPQMKQMKDKIQLLKSLGAKVIFADPQFDIMPANTVASSIGAKVEFLNPLPHNYFDNLKDIREKLNKSMR